MVESIVAANLAFHNFLLQLFMLYDCELIIHIAEKNHTRNDHYFLSGISPLLSASVLVLAPDIPSGVDIHAKACITSFSEAALAQAALKRRKRPVAFLLGNIYTLAPPRFDYRPSVIELPPIVSLKGTSLHSSKSLHKVK